MRELKFFSKLQIRLNVKQRICVCQVLNRIETHLRDNVVKSALQQPRIQNAIF